MAFLVGESFHTGDGMGWGRKGWVEMVRWDDPSNTIKDQWSTRHYDEALKKIDADVAEIKEWVYFSKLHEMATPVEEQK